MLIESQRRENRWAGLGEGLQGNREITLIFRLRHFLFWRDLPGLGDRESKNYSAERWWQLNCHEKWNQSWALMQPSPLREARRKRKGGKMWGYRRKIIGIQREKSRSTSSVGPCQKCYQVWSAHVKSIWHESGSTLWGDQRSIDHHQVR